MASISGQWWVYALLSALFAALTTIFAKIGVQHVNSDLATAIRTIVILAMAWLIVFARGEAAGLSGISRRALLFLVLSGLATGLSWIMYFRALQMGNASPVAAVDKSSLAMIIVLSALFLGEPITWRTALGAALILGGTFVLIR